MVSLVQLDMLKSSKIIELYERAEKAPDRKEAKKVLKKIKKIELKEEKEKNWWLSLWQSTKCHIGDVRVPLLVYNVKNTSAMSFSSSLNRERVMRCPPFWVGQTVKLNEEISEAQAKGYGLACADPREKLEPDREYEVSGVDVRRWATGIYVVGVEGRFNSVCFQAVASS